MSFLGLKSREERRSVSLPSSLQGEGPRCEVVIRNVSARGLTMSVRGAPPRAGTYVDIRRGSITVTGRVRWSENGCIGVRLQDRVDVAALSATLQRNGATGPVRTGEHQVTTIAAVAARADRNRDMGSAMQFVVFAAIPLGVAGVVASSLHDRLLALLATILRALR